MDNGAKTALITGGASGIGKATAKHFARQGQRVGVLDLQEEHVRKTVDEIIRDGGKAMSLVANVAEPKSLQSAIDSFAREYGRIDTVFANAGINGVWAPIEEISPEEWNRTISINLTGTFLTVKYAVPHMRANGGAIVITSSVNGTRIFSNSGASAYSSSKAGQVAFAKMLALELSTSHIRVNVVCPGAVKTSIGQNTEQRDTDKIRQPVEYKEGAEIPLTGGEAAAADEVAQLVWFLASEQASYITGTEVWIDGGTSLIRG